MHVRGHIDSEVWDDLLDLHFEDGDGLVAVLRAYIDASTREGSGLLCVAAYLFESGRVRRFRREWRETFGADTFSWADLVARQKPFKHLRAPRMQGEHDRLIAAGVALVREYVIAGAVASIWKQDVENHGPTWIKGFGHPYSIAAHMTLTGMGTWAKENGYRGGITYVIEAGDDGYDQFEHLLSYAAAKQPEMRNLYQWRAHSVVAKEPASPFHAPDLLAWEWGKYMLETGIERKREMRRSLVALMWDRLPTYHLNHLAGPGLMKFFNSIHALGVEQLEEARAELSQTSSVDVADSMTASEQTARGEGPA